MAQVHLQYSKEIIIKSTQKNKKRGSGSFIQVVAHIARELSLDVVGA